MTPTTASLVSGSIKDQQIESWSEFSQRAFYVLSTCKNDKF